MDIQLNCSLQNVDAYTIPTIQKTYQKFYLPEIFHRAEESFRRADELRNDGLCYFVIAGKLRE